MNNTSCSYLHSEKLPLFEILVFNLVAEGLEFCTGLGFTLLKLLLHSDHYIGQFCHCVLMLFFERSYLCN